MKPTEPKGPGSPKSSHLPSGIVMDFVRHPFFLQGPKSGWPLLALQARPRCRNMGRTYSYGYGISLCDSADFEVASRKHKGKPSFLTVPPLRQTPCQTTSDDSNFPPSPEQELPGKEGPCCSIPGLLSWSSLHGPFSSL